jgi:fimbrial chaperone protein
MALPNPTWARPIGLAFLFLWSLLAGAASTFHVSPVRVELGSGRGSAALTVRNEGDAPIVIQTHVVAWSQQNGEDVYTPTSEVLATPPIFSVASGAIQIARVALRREPDVGRELAYRIFLQEVPGPPRPGFQGAQLALRISIPIFVEAKKPQALKLDWSAQREPGGELRLFLNNVGGKHVQVYDLNISSVDNTAPVYSNQGASYVLPGQRRSWLLKPLEQRTLTGDRVRVKALTDTGRVESEIVLGKP